MTEDNLNNLFAEDNKKISKQNMFYHYSSFETSIEHIIIKNSLKFSNPILFNDPFDCSEKLLKVKYDKSHINEVLKQNHSYYNRKDRRSLKVDEVKRQQNLIMKEKREEFKICCFSGKNDNMLMWSHYANKHSGICCGFDFPISIPGKFLIKPVRYEDHVNLLEGETDLNKIILYWLTTKSRMWEYEIEYRAICLSKEPYKNFEISNYDPKYLKEIIFGCNIDHKQIEKAIKKLKRSIPIKDISFKRASLNIDTFNINIEDL
jgi:hypothetical protein